ncbi:MAG: hypothetical protein LBQ36_00170 [Synergistaceae bacterium]|jgi:chromosome segregation ATPase|nr:hypothetical protein [Synergistaceae bacterium]
MMIDSIIDIENGIDKIESLVKSLRDDRDKARSELASLKSALDDRELEILQMDEEHRNEINRLNEQFSEEKNAKEDLERRLGEVAARIRGLLPLMAGQTPEDAPAPPSPASPDDGM